MLILPKKRVGKRCPDPDILAITIKPPAPNGDFLKVTPEMWRESIEAALIGPVEIMRYYIPVMKDKGWGRILNIATFSAKNPMLWRLMSGPARSALIISSSVRKCRALANETDAKWRTESL